MCISTKRHYTLIYFTPRKILNQFKSFSSELPPGVTFPLPMDKDHVLNLIKILKVNIVFSQGFLIYAMNLPIPEAMEFETFHVNPFPTHLSENKYVFIQPAFKYLAIDRNRIHYTTFDENQRSQCENLGEVSLCKQTIPILMTHMHNNCEIKLFLKETSSIDLCDKRLITLHNGHFIQLTKSNSWLFAVPKTEMLTISCKDQNAPEDAYLAGTGSITISNNCKAYSPTAILMPTRTKSSNFTLEFLPPLNLADLCCDNIKHQSSLNEPILDHGYSKITLHVQDLNVASHKLDQISHLADQVEKQGKTDSYLRKFSFFTYSICIIIVLYIAYKIYKFSRTRCNCRPLCVKLEQSLTITEGSERRISRTPSLAEGIALSSLRRTT